MRRGAPRSTQTATLVPYPTLFRSGGHRLVAGRDLPHREFRRDHRARGDADVPAGAPRHDSTEASVTPTRSAICVFWQAMVADSWRSEEHTSELQSLMRISSAVC